MHFQHLFSLVILTLSFGLLYGQNSSSSGTLSDLPGGIPATSTGTDSGSPAVFAMGVALGYESLPDTTGNTMIGWNTVALTPDLTLGDFSLGLDVNIRYRFFGGADGKSFEIRPQDWIPDATHSFMDLYLPLIRYVQYGSKGSPFHARLGEVDKSILGNGFLVDSYRNTIFKPEQRILGLNIDIDGALVDFPYLGMETLVSNLAAFDILGARLYIRPGAKSDIPLLEGMQIGFSAVADTNPWFFDTDSSDGYDKYNHPSTTVVSMFGLDIKQPIVESDAFSLAFLGDIALQNVRMGSQIGVGGSVLGFVKYQAMIRMQQSGFLTSYFDGSYDLMREEKLALYVTDSTGEQLVAGWLGHLGFNFLGDALSFQATVSGPFEPDPSTLFMNPELKVYLVLKKGVLGGLEIGAFYEKKNITAFESLIDPRYALIGAQISYTLGPAVLMFGCDIRYDPDVAGDPWVISSKLETSIGLF